MMAILIMDKAVEGRRDVPGTGFDSSVAAGECAAAPTTPGGPDRGAARSGSGRVRRVTHQLLQRLRRVTVTFPLAVVTALTLLTVSESSYRASVLSLERLARLQDLRLQTQLVIKQRCHLGSGADVHVRIAGDFTDAGLDFVKPGPQ